MASKVLICSPALVTAPPDGGRASQFSGARKSHPPPSSQRPARCLLVPYLASAATEGPAPAVGTNWSASILLIGEIDLLVAGPGRDDK